MSKLRYFLWIKVVWSDNSIFISQKKYILDLFEETGMLGCKLSNTPIKVNHQLKSDEKEWVNRGKCQRLVDKLIYFSHIRSDIAYIVGVVNQFM